MVVTLPSTPPPAPSPREVQALAVVEETRRLIEAAQHWLDTQPVVIVQESPVEPPESHGERPAAAR